MRLPRFKFTIKKMLLCFAVIAVLLRFGPHLHWRIVGARSSFGDTAVRTTPLIRPSLDDNTSLVLCEVGPVSLEMPRAMAADISVHLDFLALQNESCPVFVQFPSQCTSSLPSEVDDFPRRQN